MTNDISRTGPFTLNPILNGPLIQIFFERELGIYLKLVIHSFFFYKNEVYKKDGLEMQRAPKFHGTKVISPLDFSLPESIPYLKTD